MDKKLEKEILRYVQRNKNSITSDVRIRFKIDKKHFCPLTLMCYRKTGVYFDTCYYYDAGYKLGILDKDVIDEIVSAADNRNSLNGMILPPELKEFRTSLERAIK